MVVIHLLLIIVAFVYGNMETLEGNSPTEAVQCNLCADRFNWTNCDDSAKLRECSDQLVMNTHGFLAQYNINLNQSATVVEREFRCFRLELEIDVSTVQVFIRGCTYEDSFFCDGWTENGAKATNCAVCSTEMCERNTTGDVVGTTPTTFLPIESTTTTIEVSSTTQSTSTTQVQSSSTTLVQSTSTTQTPSTSTTQTPSTSTTQTPSTSTSQAQSTSTTKRSPVTSDEPCIVDWTTTTIKAAEEVSSHQNDVTESIVQTSSQAQDLTEVAQNSASPNDLNVTPAPSVLTTTEASGVRGKNFGMNTISSILLVLGASIVI